MYAGQEYKESQSWNKMPNSRRGVRLQRDLSQHGGNNNTTYLFGLELLMPLAALRDVLRPEVKVTALLPEKGLFLLDPGVLLEQRGHLTSAFFGLLLPLFQLVRELARLEGLGLCVLQVAVLLPLQLLDLLGALVELGVLGRRGALGSLEVRLDLLQL